MLTPRQKELLDFITGFTKATGYSPSFAEMMDGVAVTSKSMIWRLLTGLEERGYIRRLPHRARAIEIVDRSLLADCSNDELFMEVARRGYTVLSREFLATLAPRARKPYAPANEEA